MITIDKKVKLNMQSGYKPIRWSTLRFNPNASTDGVIIRAKSKDGATVITVYPYEEVDCGKFGRFVWFQLLKLLTFLKLI